MEAHYCPYCGEVRVVLGHTDAYMIPGNLVDSVSDYVEDINDIIKDDDCKRVNEYACFGCNKAFYVLEG